jgi:MFS family permease
LGDRFGKLNCNIFFNLIAGLSNLLIWTFANSFGTLMAFSVVFGFTSGSYFALMSPISATILPMDRFHSGLSLILFTNAFPVFGSNIASAIQSGVNAAPFISYKMFTGVVYVIGALILIVLKLRLNKNFFAII